MKNLDVPKGMAHLPFVRNLNPAAKSSRKHASHDTTEAGLASSHAGPVTAGITSAGRFPDSRVPAVAMGETFQTLSYTRRTGN